MAYLWNKNFRMIITSLSAAVAAAHLMLAGVSASDGTLQPSEDYSYYADPSVDSDGYLHLTDNQTVTDVSVTKLRMKNFDFSIPGAWAEQVVIRTRYMNQTKSANLYKTQIQDSYVIRFYEKETWNKYHSSAYRDQENASSMGELAEMRLMNSAKNDTARWKNDPLYIFFGTATRGDTEYEAFLYRPKISDGLIDTEFSSRYGYLSDINYQGCLISSFSCKNGFSLSYPNAYIRNHFVSGFQKNAEGIAAGSTIPDNYVPKTLLAEKNSSDTAPEKLNTVEENVSTAEYAWNTFTPIWQFEDRGADYYQNLMAAVARITAVPTVTVTPTPSVTPTVTAVPTQTPYPTAEPEPTEKPTATPSPEISETPAPTEEPTPEVTSVPANPDTNEEEK